MNINRRVVLLIMGVVVVLAVLLAAIFSSNKSKNDAKGEYLDPFSHQTVSDPEGKTPDTFGVPGNQPLYLGIGSLVERGISSDQLDALKSAFYKYATTDGRGIKEISINVDQITKKRDRSTPNQTFLMLFPVRFDRKDTFNAQVDHTNPKAIRLYLLDQSSGKVVYDSGVIITADRSGDRVH